MNGMNEILDGFNPASLVAFKALADATYGNKYLEPVNIPAYVGGARQLIVTTANWDSGNILNSASYDNFYIEAGVYPGTAVITASGTEGTRKTLALYPIADTHPASLADNEQASLWFEFDGGSYWTMDRVSSLDNVTIRVGYSNGASYNIVNRWHLRNYYYGVRIYEECHYNTVQNSYINHQTHAGRINDGVGLALDSASEGSTSWHTKFINNDIRNANDGIQPIDNNGHATGKYNGTIMDSNRIWFDEEAYTDNDWATNGYSNDPNSEFMIGENCIDVKNGSDDPLNPMVISNNMMWGVREGDDTFTGNTDSGAHHAISLHYGARYVEMKSNIIFDSQGAIIISDGGIFNSKIENNIFQDIGVVHPDDDFNIGIAISAGDDISVDNNTMVNFPLAGGGGRAFGFGDTLTTGTFNNNVAISAEDFSSNASTIDSIDNNYWYDSSEQMSGTNDHTYATAGEAIQTDNYVFNYERFTSSPKTKVVTGVITTASSPHNGLAGSDITVTGIEPDEPYGPEDCNNPDIDIYTDAPSNVVTWDVATRTTTVDVNEVDITGRPQWQPRASTLTTQLVHVVNTFVVTQGTAVVSNLAGYASDGVTQVPMDGLPFVLPVGTHTFEFDGYLRHDRDNQIVIELKTFDNETTIPFDLTCETSIKEVL